jgi:hypothetical protein
MKAKFAYKFILFSLPFIFLICTYIAEDPFKVLYHYKNYYSPTGQVFSLPNRDFASTELFLNNYESHRYNSFIFGNSRSIFYHVKDWEKHIPAGSYYHFDASKESLYGINKKMKFLDHKGVKIKTALFVIDASVLSVIKNSDGHIFIKDPVTSGESKIAFQLEFFKVFIDYRIFISFLDYKLTGKKDRFFDVVADELTVLCNNDNNEITWPVLDSAIAANSKAYYESPKSPLYKRDSVELLLPPVIRDTQKIMLAEMRDILVKDSTQYKFVISPLYSEQKMNPADISYLKLLFGEQNVFDFSGRNSISENKYNYYETSHYRPQVATYIMDSIYSAEDALK